MPSLARLIDNMPSPSLPAYFSDDERQLLRLLLASAKQQARPYAGDYRADWLLSPFEAAEWVTTNRGREEQVADGWQNVIRINWAVRLANGSLLTDPKYHALLNLNKQIAFLIRSGHVSHISAPFTWKATVSVLLQLTRWLVLHEAQFFPETFGLKLVNQFALDSLLCAIADGGWAEAQRIPQRLLMHFYLKTYGETCPQQFMESVYELPVAVKGQITTWLKANAYFGLVCRGAYVNKAYLKRERLANDIGEPVESLRMSWKLSAFCRQFEPELQAGVLLVNIFQETEKPDHKTKTTNEIVTTGSAENTLLSVSRSLTTILSAYRHSPNMMPEPALLSVRRAQNLAESRTRQSGHHQFMPVDTGLAYFNRAMQFVQLYGDALIDYYLAVISNKSPMATTSSLNTLCDGLLGDAFQVTVKGETKSVGAVLGISEFMRPEVVVDYELLRKQPSLDEALRVLVGACVICIALMKPSRENELTHLHRDCLRWDGKGYHIRFKLGKSNAGEAYQDMDRPIPVITAKAIQLLQKLGNGLTLLFNDSKKKSNNLFYLPKQKGIGAMVADAGLLNGHLDIFCDYVGLPPDSHGRRWYVRIHEMRKWFLLLLFWSGKYDVLDAARWIAGHTDSSHIYAYIEREFPGEELPKLEAEYAIDRLRALDSLGGKQTQAETGLNSLYEAVLCHFGVQSLSVVPEAEWADYVATLRHEDGFKLEPHSVYAETNSTEVTGMTVSFILRETA